MQCSLLRDSVSRMLLFSKLYLTIFQHENHTAFSKHISKIIIHINKHISIYMFVYLYELLFLLVIAYAF